MKSKVIYNAAAYLRLSREDALGQSGYAEQ